MRLMHRPGGLRNCLTRRRARPMGQAGLIAAALLAAIATSPAIQAKPRPVPAPAAAAGRATAASAVLENDGTRTLVAEGAPHTRVSSFRQLGQLSPMELRGVEGSAQLPFNIRDDELVTGARLKLSYTYSPALLPQISHLNVRVNDEVVATLPLPKEEAGTTVTRSIAINPVLLGEFNRLTLQLIGHYTLECEDPLHSSLWANISNTSELALELAPVALANDLRTLPAPFFDPKDPSPVRLPFVLPGHSPAQLEAAGAVASWFGALSAYRGASFPLLQAMPAQGHAVLLVQGGKSPVPGLTLPAIQGPTLAIQTNPQDPLGKLLLVMGRNEAELKLAATALALGGNTLSGASMGITALEDLKPRQPYDAPRWIPSDRPIKLGELAPVGELTARGYSDAVIRVPVRFPPALSSWRGATAPLTLSYRHSPHPERDKSVLNIGVNGRHIRALPLSGSSGLLGGAKSLLKDSTGLGGDLLLARERIELPVYQLPASGDLVFHFSYDVNKQGACKDVVLDNQRGVVDPDSTLDLSELHHFAAMPDLASFANQGFPFTRLADLAETSVVLTAQPKDAEISAYLALMARFAAATGFPAVRVAVHTGADLATLAGRDLLVIGSAADLPLLQQWDNRLPIALAAQSRRVDVSDAWARLNLWLRGDPERPGDPALGRLSLQGHGGDAYLMGFESPLTAGRSVVAVVASQADAFENLVDALTDPELLTRVHGSVVSVRQRQVDSLSDAVDYHVGSLGLIDGMRWYLAHHPLLLFVLLGLGALLLAVPMYVGLRRRAQQRLKTGS